MSEMKRRERGPGRSFQQRNAGRKTARVEGMKEIREK